MIAAEANDFASWRETARKLLASGVRPVNVTWNAETAALFPTSAPPSNGLVAVPKDFVELAKTVALHRNPEPWDLLYRLLFRLTHGERHLLKVDVDDDVRKALLMEKAIRRDMHKMTAFVRFRKVAGFSPRAIRCLAPA